MSYFLKLDFPTCKLNSSHYINPMTLYDNVFSCNLIILWSPRRMNFGEISQYLLLFQIVMEYCGAGSVSDIMRLRNKTVSSIKIYISRDLDGQLI